MTQPFKCASAWLDQNSNTFQDLTWWPVMLLVWPYSYRRWWHFTKTSWSLPRQMSAIFMHLGMPVVLAERHNQNSLLHSSGRNRKFVYHQHLNWERGYATGWVPSSCVKNKRFWAINDVGCRLWIEDITTSVYHALTDKIETSWSQLLIGLNLLQLVVHKDGMLPAQCYSGWLLSHWVMDLSSMITSI